MSKKRTKRAKKVRENGPVKMNRDARKENQALKSHPRALGGKPEESPAKKKF